jgi:hypothetical protein
LAPRQAVDTGKEVQLTVSVACTADLYP